ncbi:MAG: phenylalanine--tRNA ligase subunit alpha [Clostridia bacterium]|nr:phenylalanine--tRNA ligase subunit alpha [Clostridia bacterium]
MKDRLMNLQAECLQKLDSANTLAALEEIRVTYLGKKGPLTEILRGMGALPAEERPIVGEIANQVRTTLADALAAKKEALGAAADAARLEAEKLDVTAPAVLKNLGGRHPIALVQEEIENIFISMGFSVEDGPEVETDYYNFEALNTPADHPARDVQDTFYVTEKVLLRTQTSPVQARTMEKTNPPIRMICPGRVYRSDAVDATHSPMFHQIEGLVVDRGITMGDLKGTLDLFAQKMFGEQTKTRFRPHHFPFTEPSAEVDVSCFVCGGEGCSLCKGEGWIEILGAGMVHPNVLRASGIDPEEYSGFAFGMGVERIVMTRYGINDMRYLYENDVRFLRQFS